MPPSLIGGGIKQCFCLTSCLSDVCLSRTSDLSREQRGLGRPKLAQRYPASHVTQTPLSRSKGQGHQATLLNAALTHKVAAAVSVGTYCYVASARRRAMCRAPTGEERGGAYCVAMHTACWNWLTVAKVILDIEKATLFWNTGSYLWQHDHVLWHLVHPRYLEIHKLLPYSGKKAV